VFAWPETGPTAVDSCDVLIVGGGPAGSSCATRLRAAGVDVLVVDRASFPRDKPCAGWITPATLQALDVSAAEYGDGRTLQPFTGFRTGMLGGPWVETHYGEPVSFGVLRRELDDFLLRRSGARFRGGTPVTRLRRCGQHWVVNDEIRTPLVVGAGGHFCPVARLLNGFGDATSVVIAQAAELPVDARLRSACKVRPEVPQLYFSRDLRGYGWCVRKGDFLNVGLGRRGHGRLKQHVREFLGSLGDTGELSGALAAAWRGHAYALYEGVPRRLGDDGVLLLGDAAGLAAPASGEGIRPAIESGQLAAAAILEADGRYGRECLESYSRAIEVRFGRRQRRIPLLTLPLAALAPHLLASRWLARHVILDRWFLQPPRAAAA